ncbi:MAG: helix-turn-helix domain-containing protein [Chloroflexaceae bacterium]|nr:helix-turn-helix domain-containing protein [Chloroflexaceae bacterium]
MIPLALTQMLKHFDRESLIWASQVPPTEKLLLLALNSFVDGMGKCWPGRDRLAQMMGCGLATVKRAVQSLESKQILSREARRANGRQTSNLYTVNFEIIRGSYCTPETPGAHIEPQPGAHIEPQPGAHIEPRSIQGLTIQDLTIQSSSSSDRDRVLGEKPPKKVEPFPVFDSHKTVRRIEMVQTIPRWDVNAPWSDDEERKRFDDWLRVKYAAKHDPPRYAAVIVGKVAKGQPSVDWEEFQSKPQAAIAQSREADVLAQWGDRQDWENFPLLDDWRQRCDQMGWLNFCNLGNRRNSAHDRFTRWIRGIA